MCYRKEVELRLPVPPVALTDGGEDMPPLYGRNAWPLEGMVLPYVRGAVVEVH